jgi:hypothetical protein
MAQLLAFFRPRNYFESIVTSQHIANHAMVSSELLHEIRNHPMEFAKYIGLQHEQSLFEIEKLTLVHLLLIHAP